MERMRRVIALVLCFVLLAGVVPAGALAAETEQEIVIALDELTMAAASGETVAAEPAAETQAAETEAADATTAPAEAEEGSVSVTMENGDVIRAEAEGLTGITAVPNGTDLSAVLDTAAYAAYDITLAGYSEGQVTVTMDLKGLDAGTAVVYYVNSDGTLTEITDFAASSMEGGASICFTAEAGAFTVAAGSPAAVEEEPELERLEVLWPAEKNYFLTGDAVDLLGLEVFAVYTSGDQLILEQYLGEIVEGEEIPNEYYTLTFGPYLDDEGTVLAVTVSYKDMSASTQVQICVEEQTFGNVTVRFDTPSVKSLTVAAVEVSEEIASAMADNLNTEKPMAAYSAEAEYAGTEDLAGTATITLPIPEGVENPTVYYLSEDGATTRELITVNNGDGTLTFYTRHLATFVVGESAGVSDSQEFETTEKITAYVLVDSMRAGGEYLIVTTNSPTTNSHLLTGGNRRVTATNEVTVQSGEDADHNALIHIAAEEAVTGTIWKAISATGGYQLQSDNGYYLQYSNGSLTTTSSSRNATTWSFSNNTLSYNNNRTYYVRFANGSWGLVSNDATNAKVYIYEKQDIEKHTHEVLQGTYTLSAKNVVTAVSSGEKKTEVQLESSLIFTPDNGAHATVTDVSTTARYERVSGDGDVIESIENGVITFTGKPGKVTVMVSYTGANGTVTDYITVEAKEPYYTIELYELIEDAVFDESGSLVTPPVIGEEITAPVVLKGVEAGETFAVWAVVKHYDGIHADGVDIGVLEGDPEKDPGQITWASSNTGIATADSVTGVLTFTGNDYGTFTLPAYFLDWEGNILCSDEVTISVSKSEYVEIGDGTDDFPEYPDEGAVRFNKTATALGNYSETGIAMVEIAMTGVPYSTGNELDVVIMLDRSTSMNDDRIEATVAATKAFIKSIVLNEDGTYNGNRVYVGYFMGETTYDITDGSNIGKALDSVDNDTEYNALMDAIDGFTRQSRYSGTDWQSGLIRSKGVLDEYGTDDRQQFVVFMSDGAPSIYQELNGDLDDTHSLVNGSSWVTNGARNSSYKYEHHSTVLKSEGVTVFSVLLGETDIQPQLLMNDVSGPGVKEGEQVTHDTGSTMSKLNSYYYLVEDEGAAENMETVFAGIAQKIVEAATNVEVEDKIGNDFTLNLSVPGYGTDHALSSVALDGVTEFYIQVVEYTLDDTKERVGDPAVLENFTFNPDGSVKSHSVDGVETCTGSCSHVTLVSETVENSEGNVTTVYSATGIDGKYFTYTFDENGEVLTWQADKITTTELALQYFAHLDDSTGVHLDDQTGAGTHYTNEYATLVYTNYKGNKVQVELPRPQMTWNGAQVSYVFYLVNQNGQPVNRAGRVVPFAEAVYVTDVHTEAVTWNTIEQVAGLDAQRLASELVPSVYQLYDEAASYTIHVYEDEKGAHLNNNFVIGGGNVANPNTTYVFNNKSDAVKYNTVGAYVPFGHEEVFDDERHGYLCKSDYIEDAIPVPVVDEGGTAYYRVELPEGYVYAPVGDEVQVPAEKLGSTTGATVIDGYAYYVDEKGVYTIVEKFVYTVTEKGFDYSNTTVAFAVVWTPALQADTVVLDYGLDAVINVIANDAMAAGVTAVMKEAPDNVVMNTGTYRAAIASNSIDGGSWTAQVETIQTIRFIQKDMLFNEPVQFYYQAGVNYYEDPHDTTPASANMYSSVTVIPATTVYYEDSFLTLESWSRTEDTWTRDENSQWTASPKSGTSQETDRPGPNDIGSLYDDADNAYGYDEAYGSMSQHSLGSSAKITVDAETRGEATFSFWGTGFDVIGVTSNDTGTLIVEVFEGDKAEGTAVKTLMVDTYYGYEYLPHKVEMTYAPESGWVEGVVEKVETVGTDDPIPEEPGEGETYTYYEYRWVPTANDPNGLYQVPVMKVSGLEYKQYTAKLTASYGAIFDHDKAGSYDMYLDAIRIYDPTGNRNTTANEAYVQDGEGWPVYEEVRNNIIKASGVTVTYNSNGTFTVSPEDAVLGNALFIDPDDATVSIADYVNYGPNNEVYLAKDQSVVFSVPLSGLANVADVQLGMKSATGTAAKVTMTILQGGVEIYRSTGSVARSTTTDLYYSIGGNIQDLSQDATIILTNSGDMGSIASVTNVKLTFTQDPYGIETVLGGITGQEAAAVLTLLQQRSAGETPAAKPEAELDVSIRDKSVKAGRSVTVQAVTSSDVAYLMVNGQKVTSYSENKNTGKRTWSVSLKAEEAGTLQIAVTACSAEKEALETVTETVEVTAKTGAVQQIVGQLIGMLGR